jgi:hypothetical protein
MGAAVYIYDVTTDLDADTNGYWVARTKNMNCCTVQREIVCEDRCSDTLPMNTGPNNPAFLSVSRSLHLNGFRM